MEKYYQEFEDTEENKLIYMDIFKEYVSLQILMEWFLHKPISISFVNDRGPKQQQFKFAMV